MARLFEVVNPCCYSRLASYPWFCGDDAVGRQTATIDALGNRTTTIYDAAGRVATVIDADSTRTTFVYDAVGNRTMVTDPLGHRATFAYNAANLLTASSSVTNRVTWTYNNAGNLLTAANTNGALRQGLRCGQSHDAGQRRCEAECLGRQHVLA